MILFGFNNYSYVPGVSNIAQRNFIIFSFAIICWSLLLNISGFIAGWSGEADKMLYIQVECIKRSLDILSTLLLLAYGLSVTTDDIC